jgi:hypothetical protein
MSKARTAAVLTALVLCLAACLAACGSNDDEKATQNLSDFLVKANKSPQLTSPFFSIKRKDADCIASGMVKKIGTDQLQEYGLLDKNLEVQNVTHLKMSKADAETTTDVAFGCTDIVAKEQKAAAASGQVPKTMRPCLNKVLTEDNLRHMFVQVFQGDQNAAQRELVRPMLKCALGSKGQ